MNFENIRKKTIDDNSWFVLRDVCKELGHTYDNDIVPKFRKLLPKCITKMEASDAMGRVRMTNYVSLEGIAFVRQMKKPKNKSGVVFAFIPIASVMLDMNIFVVGKHKDKKFSNIRYRGFNTPSKILLCRCVKDRILAEEELINTLTSHKWFTLRPDFGNNWFQTKLKIPEIKDILESLDCLCSKDASNIVD